MAFYPTNIGGSGDGSVSNIVPSGYINFDGTILALPWTSQSTRGNGVIIGVQNATQLTLSRNPYTTLYKIKADGSVDVESLNSGSTSHTYDVSDYEIVFVYNFSGSNYVITYSIA